MSLTRRTQVLLDDERYRRLEERAKETGRSVASIIRDAIDTALDHEDPDARHRAGLRLLSAPQPEQPEPDWEESKRAMLDEHGA
jgi:hypothetical protein